MVANEDIACSQSQSRSYMAPSLVHAFSVCLFKIVHGMNFVVCLYFGFIICAVSVIV